MLMNDRPEQFSLLYDARPCETVDTVLCFKMDQVLLCKTDEALTLPTWGDLKTVLQYQTPLHIFTQSDRRVFILNLSEPLQLPEGLVFDSIRVFRSFASREDSFALMTAYHLSIWYARHAHCGACGGHTQPAAAERALVCDQCGLIQYPTISPAVITAITDGDRILLARNAYGTFKHYSLIAGYVEVGETLEQTVQREIMEEVGLRVKDIRYIASQPWGLSQSMMIGFHARLDGAPDITLQTSELADAGWFRSSELPEHAGIASIAFSLIERFRLGKFD